MNGKLVALIFGAGIGFVFVWAGLSDPAVIRAMLLLRQADVFLLMGSAIVVAAIGVRLLRYIRLRATATGEPVGWSSEPAERRHVIGSVIFGAGWAVAGTCPGPVAVMIGEGRLAGFAVATGLVVGVMLARPSTARPAATPARDVPGVAGL